uniref:Uncharacterized protein n=1 Tax=Rhizophora mucronata TaxID=61149 RepID=A0A2P2N820_RHIMU
MNQIASKPLFQDLTKLLVPFRSDIWNFSKECLMSPKIKIKNSQDIETLLFHEF